ncbi:MAG: hypothetical protein AAGH57_10615 [Pseudomonadota bacterium]
MLVPTDFPQHVSDRLLAVAAALALTGVLFATAIVPASPVIATSPIAMGVLA